MPPPTHIVTTAVRALRRRRFMTHRRGRRCGSFMSFIRPSANQRKFTEDRMLSASAGTTKDPLQQNSFQLMCRGRSEESTTLKDDDTLVGAVEAVRPLKTNSSKDCTLNNILSYETDLRSSRATATIAEHERPSEPARNDNYERGSRAPVEYVGELAE